jgi:16S rRNA (guanine527-N7)-methyltransferase
MIKTPFSVDRNVLEADRIVAENIMAPLHLESAVVDRLSLFVDYLIEAQEKTNLVARSTLETIWTRHIADSAQILPLAPPEARCWLDVGSGGGFPGLVIGIIRPDLALHLVDSNGKKCRFLEMVAHRLNLSVHVHCARIEEIVPLFAKRVDVVSARALAPLSKLLHLLDPILQNKACGIFLKGENAAQEIAELTPAQKRAIVCIPSLTHATASVLKFQKQI